MTSKAQRSRKAASRSRARSQPRWLPWGVLGLAVLTLVFLASIGPGRLSGLLAGLFSPKGQGPLSLTIVHSNDTWGYIFPCG